MNTVNIDIDEEPDKSDLAEGAEDMTHQANEVARDFSDSTRDAAKRGSDAAKEMYHAASAKAGETLEVSREYARRHPASVFLGAIALGVAGGYLVMLMRRKPTVGERYVEEPLAAVREAFLGALSPVSHSVHQGYDSARHGAGKAMDQLNRFSSKRGRKKMSHRLGRVGNNLKFW